MWELEQPCIWRAAGVRQRMLKTGWLHQAQWGPAWMHSSQLDAPVGHWFLSDHPGHVRVSSSRQRLSSFHILLLQWDFSISLERNQLNVLKLIQEEENNACYISNVYEGSSFTLWCWFFFQVLFVCGLHPLNYVFMSMLFFTSLLGKKTIQAGECVQHDIASSLFPYVSQMYTVLDLPEHTYGFHSNTLVNRYK